MPVLFVNDLDKHTNSFNQRFLKQNKITGTLQKAECLFLFCAIELSHVHSIRKRLSAQGSFHLRFYFRLITTISGVLPIRTGEPHSP